jgi:hypothetical protein
MQNIDDFTARDIFVYDKDGNTLYKRNGVYYLINDKKLQNRLRDIEGYRSFLQHRTLRFIIFFPVFLVSLLIFFIAFLLGYDFENSSAYNIIFFIIFFGVYIYIKYLYEAKINEILKECKVVEFNPKELKEPIEIKKNIKIYPPKKPFIQRAKSAIPDFNLFHIVMFIIIAFPFLYMIYIIIKGMILG